MQMYLAHVRESSTANPESSLLVRAITKCLLGHEIGHAVRSRME